MNEYTELTNVKGHVTINAEVVVPLPKRLVKTVACLTFFQSLRIKEP